MWNLAIDFGTSNTTGAAWADGAVRPVEVAGDRRVPSVVLLGADGHWVVGREADNQSVIVPERVERAPKRRVGKGHTLLLGGQAVPITSAIAALLGPHTQAARALHPGEPANIVLTHPARWGPERIDVLRTAAHEAGFGQVEFCPEPVAAAHRVDDALEVGQHAAVYDLGGGTFDTCVVRRTETSFKVVGLPGGTERIGGEDFDHRMYQHLGEAVGREDASVWEAMQTSDDRRWQRAAADLLTQGRTAKEQLSGNPRASVYVGSLERDITVTRDEFEALISADVDRTVDEMVRTIESAGLTDTDIARVYLVGGSSRLPIVQQRMGARFGSRIATWDDPKGAIVMGAAMFSGTLGAAGGDPGPDAAAPTPSGPVVVSAPPPRTGPITDPPPAAPAWDPNAAPAYPAAPAWDPNAAPAAPAAPAWDPNAAPAAPAYPDPAAPAYAAPAYPTPAPTSYEPAAAPGGYPPPGPPAPSPKAPGSDKMTFAWVGAATFLLCCLPGPAVGLYFANEAKKAGHPQAQMAFILNVVALSLLVVFWGLTLLNAAAGA